MPKYQVRKGQKLPHQGQVLAAGAIVELPRRLAHEIPHLVDEVDASGQVLASPAPAWRQSIETVRDHEKASVLAEQRAIAAARIPGFQVLMEEAAADAQAAVKNYQDAVQVVDDIDAAIAALAEPPAPAQATSSKKSPAAAAAAKEQ